MRNAEDIATKWMAEVPHLIQPEQSITAMANAILVAIEALEAIATYQVPGSTAGTAREALEKIRGDKIVKFRKKPVVIEAVKYLSNYDCLPEWARKAGCETWREGHRVMEIHTLEGTMRAQSGDWLIQGINGEVYPCKPDIFDATYERVDP